MASFHCSVKVGRTGSGGSHADYITRTGKYATKEKDDLEHSESGNLPAWADSPKDFWRAADEHERANGTVYREFEIALPRELTPAQRLNMVREFVQQEIGDRHAYTFAIHNPRATIEGGEQPHAHIMFSERQRDAIEREAAQYFKRWNAKAPERGGCQKANKAATSTERKTALVKFRERFASMQNRHLAKHGHKAEVTHLSLEAQGIDRAPEPHLGPKVAAAVAKDVQALRSAPSHEVDPVRPSLENSQFVRIEQEAVSQVNQKIDQAMRGFKANYEKAKTEHDKAQYLKDRAQEQGFLTLGKLQNMPPQPKLIGRKAWEEQKASLTAHFEKAKEVNEAAGKAIERASEAMKRFGAGLHRPSVEKAVLEALRKSEPHLAQAYTQAKEMEAEQTRKRVQEAKEQARNKATQRERGLSR
jgi:hypothetical protein